MACVCVSFAPLQLRTFQLMFLLLLSFPFFDRTFMIYLRLTHYYFLRFSFISLLSCCYLSFQRFFFCIRITVYMVVWITFYSIRFFLVVVLSFVKHTWEGEIWNNSSELIKSLADFQFYFLSLSLSFSISLCVFACLLSEIWNHCHAERIDFWLWLPSNCAAVTANGWIYLIENLWLKVWLFCGQKWDPFTFFLNIARDRRSDSFC